MTQEDLVSLREMATLLKSTAGRVSSLQSQMDRAATGGAKPGDADRPTATQVQEATKSTVKWDKFKEDFPEWAEAFEERAGIAQPAQQVDASAIAKNIRDELTAAYDAEREAEIEELHPGWQGKVKAPSFLEWATHHADEKDRQVIASSKSPVRVDGMLRRYDAWIQSSTSAPTAVAAPRAAPTNLAAAVNPKGGRSSPKVSASELDGEALWNHLAQEQ